MTAKNINVPAPIQPGDKKNINGVCVIFNVKIPDFTHNIKNPAFGKFINEVHKQQERIIDSENKKALAQIEKMTNTGHCCVL